MPRKEGTGKNIDELSTLNYFYVTNQSYVMDPVS